ETRSALWMTLYSKLNPRSSMLYPRDAIKTKTGGCHRSATGRRQKMISARKDVFRTENVYWVDFRCRRKATCGARTRRGAGTFAKDWTPLVPCPGRRRGSEGRFSGRHREPKTPST